MSFNLSSSQKLIVKGFTLLISVFLILSFSYFFKNNLVIQSFVSKWGYVGIFFIALAGGFNFIIPVPVISFLPLFLESGLSFWTTIIIITIGMSVADLIAYFLAITGRKLVSDSKQKKLIVKLNKVKEKHFFKPIILFYIFAAFAPLPNEIMIIPLGFLGYSLKYLVFPLFFGNFIFNLIVASGIISIFY